MRNCKVYTYIGGFSYHFGSLITVHNWKSHMFSCYGLTERNNKFAILHDGDIAENSSMTNMPFYFDIFWIHARHLHLSVY